MNEFITKLRNGEISETEAKEFESKLSETGKGLLKEALAFVTKRQDEGTKAADLEKKTAELAENIRTEEEKLSKMKDQGAQFRQEQVQKAKDKFFAEYKIPAEQQAQYDDKFKALDSGKVDSDLIYNDFVGIYAFLNKDTLLEAKKKEVDMQRQADDEAARAAGAGNGSGGPEDKKPKFSEAVSTLAKTAGISEEAANRQINGEGMGRTLGE